MVLCSLNTLGIQHSSCVLDTQIFFFFLLPDWGFNRLDTSMKNIVLLTQTAHVSVLSIQQIYSAESFMPMLQPVQPPSKYQVRLWECWL